MCAIRQPSEVLRYSITSVVMRQSADLPASPVSASCFQRPVALCPSGASGDHRAEPQPRVEPSGRNAVGALPHPLAQPVFEPLAADRVMLGQDHLDIGRGERGHGLPVAGHRVVAPFGLEPLDLADRAQVLDLGGLAREVLRDGAAVTATRNQVRWITASPFSAAD